MTRSAAVRTAVLALLALVTVGACAQPGQLGHSGEDAATPTPTSTEVAPTSIAGQPVAPDALPGPVAQSGSDARGRLEAPVRIGTPGPAEVLVRTETLAPGQRTGWISHPGTVVSVVRSGTVTVVQADACTPAPVGAEQAFFVPDAAAYELRNDGPDPAVLTRTELLAPGAEERRPADPAC